jgi:hypothetical protein
MISHLNQNNPVNLLYLIALNIDLMTENGAQKSIWEISEVRSLPR